MDIDPMALTQQAVQGGVGVMIGVVRQQFVRQQPTGGPTGDDVGKRAAPVDPKLPAGGDGERSW